MPDFSHIIFDLDGTLTDNTQGISNSVKYALKQMQNQQDNQQNQQNQDNQDKNDQNQD